MSRDVTSTIVSAAIATLWVVLVVKIINSQRGNGRTDDDNFTYQSNAKDPALTDGFWKGFPGKLFRRKKLNCRGRPGDPSTSSTSSGDNNTAASASTSPEIGNYDKARVRLFKDGKWEDAGRDAKVVLRLAGDEVDESRALWQLCLERGQQCILQADISDQLKLREAGSNKAVKLTAGGQFWELQFPSSSAMRGFIADFHDKFELNKPRLLRQPRRTGVGAK